MMIRCAIRFVLALWATALCASVANAAVGCDALRGFQAGATSVLMAEVQPGHAFKAPDGKTYDGVGSFCRLVTVSRPTPQSRILIEIWLPDPASWNGKLLGTGNGGFAGSIRYAALAGGLKRGYAVANTDMGTSPASIVGGAGYDAGNGQPEVVRDWGYRATHQMAEITRLVADRYYGRPAAHSYYSGCSTGGHQGLTEAQRYPDDYDAILVGAPGNNRTHLHAAFTWFGATLRQAGGPIPPAAMAQWSKALLEHCAGKDGGAPSDAFLTDPTRCTFKPAELRCISSARAGDCLTDAQVAALTRIYGGVRNPRTGSLIYPAEVRGSEAMLGLFLANPESLSRPVPVDLARWVFGPQFDGATFDFDHDMDQEDDVLGPDVNANDPDLSRFAARGGKLIIFHGWADAIVSPLDSILYYDRIMTRRGLPDKAGFVRLFMAPGVGHCLGGPGPDAFGQGAEFAPGDADHDLLTALDRWASQGKAPEQVVATKRTAEGSLEKAAAEAAVMTRPLCAYPAIARYNGQGDPRMASSFTCTPAAPSVFERPAPQYLH